MWSPHGDRDNNEEIRSSLRSILISKRNIHNSSLTRPIFELQYKNRGLHAGTLIDSICTFHQVSILRIPNESYKMRLLLIHADLMDFEASGALPHRIWGNKDLIWMYKSFTIKCKGHPLSELSRSIKPESKIEKKHVDV